jgi:hypothetical protein
LPLQDLDGSSRVRIELREDNWWPVADDLIRVLSTSTVNDGSFTWTTPDSGLEGRDDYRIFIRLVSS